jgi:glycosyltransferase involved in cell wall biosynthesis
LRILFVHQELVSFVSNDLDILRSTHQVYEFQFRGLKDIPSLLRSAQGADLAFSWFGKLHAFFTIFFSKLLDKKVVVVAGGDDVAYEPEIKYGMFSYWWKKWCPLFLFRHADLILSVSEFNRRETIQNARANPSTVKLLYHGFDAQKWHCLNKMEKEKLVLTVGRVTDETFHKKGLDLFVRSAAHLPDVSFVMVGPWHDNAIVRLRAIASPNVTFTGGLYGEDLIRIYGQAKVYVQVSIHESFGCSVAEAMLCECVPVVSHRAALPEVVGDCGFYVDALTPEAVAAQIEKALASDLGHKARERIMREFPLDKRRNELLAAVDEVMRK